MTRSLAESTESGETRGAGGSAPREGAQRPELLDVPNAAIATSSSVRPNVPACATDPTIISKAPLPADAPSPDRDAAPHGLVQQSITEDSAESLAFRLAQVDSYLDDWRADLAKTLRERAHAAELRGDDPSWWAQRADALEARWGLRAANCGEVRTLVLTCKGCGQTRERPLPCALRHWCAECAEVRRRREYARLVPALSQRTKEERQRWYRAGKPWRGAPQLRLLTLTVRTGETLEETRASIARAWPLWRRWLWDRIGYAPPYAATWEVTDGPAGPHPHLHVCIVLPWVDVRAMAAAWVHATRGAAEVQGLDLRTVKATEAARYVAAYVTASTLDDELDPETAAAWVRATYARRLVTTSRAFWLPVVERVRCDCGECRPLLVNVERAEDPNAARGPPVERISARGMGAALREG